MKHFFTFIFICISSFLIAQTTTVNLMHDGESREYILHVPASYNPTTDTVPLIIALHGLGDTMSNFSQIGFHQLANTENFIVATPQALDPTEVVDVFGFSIAVNTILQNAWNSGAGGTSMAGIPITLPEPLYPSASHDDVGFINAIIDSLSANYNINQDRVYATGFSMGGFMTNRLACELSDRIAAVATVGGTLGSGVPECLPYRAVPSAHFHSHDDGTVAYSNNTWGLDAEDLVAHWVNNNACDETPTITNIPDNDNDGITVIKYLYEGGNDGSEVEFWEVSGADHVGTWMGGSQDINTTLKIWEFFQRYEKSAQDPGYDHNIDTTGTVDTTTAINDYWIENTIVLSPNPTTDILTISNISINEMKNIQVVNMLGQIIFSSAITKTEAQIDVSKFNNGIYILQLTNREGKISTTLFEKR